MKVWHTRPQHVPGYFGIVPFDREGDRRIAQHAEVIRIVRVLPDIFPIDDHVLAERLLESGVKFVPEAGSQGRIQARVPLQRGLQGVHYGVVASLLARHQVFVEGSFEGPRIGDA